MLTKRTLEKVRAHQRAHGSTERHQFGGPEPDNHAMHERIARESTPKPNFDADLSPQHQTNQEAARARGLHWSTKNGGCWVGSGGNPIRDKFGQPY